MTPTDVGIRTLVQGTHLCQTHLCQEMNKGRENERERELGGKRKQNLQHRRKQVTNIRTNANLGHVAPDHACHLSCCVT